MEIFLARWLGLYLAIIGLFVLTRRSFLNKALSELKQSNLLILLTGAYRLIFGLFILMSKPMWDLHWTLIITLIAILLILSGLYRLFLPASFSKLIEKMKTSSFLYSGIIFLIVGLFLIYKGFIVE